MTSAVFELFFRTFQETFLYQSTDWNATYKSKSLRTEPGHKEDHVCSMSRRQTAQGGISKGFMKIITFAFAIATTLGLSVVGAQDAGKVTSANQAKAVVEQLKRMTQELLDAVAPGGVAEVSRGRLPLHRRRRRRENQRRFAQGIEAAAARLCGLDQDG